MRKWLIAGVLVLGGCAGPSTTSPPPSPPLPAVSDAGNPITEFQGEHRWLSNFWPCGVEFEGVMYPSAEHAYQAAKTLDEGARRRIAGLATAAEAKAAGR